MNAASGLIIGSIVLSVLLLSGCAKEPETRAAPRPVRVFQVGERTNNDGIAYAGEVKARYETKLSFRVPGKVIARHVEIGERVRKGQLLAQLDPVDYQLASKGLASQLSAARAERDFAKDDLARYKELLEQKFISATDYARTDTRYKTARDRVAALESQLAQASNQAAYTNLYADREGVMTALEVETGQVVAAGQIVMRIAQLDEKEVVINVPEDRVAELRSATEVTVALWADGTRRLKGRIREIAPSADPATRTYAVKVTLLEGGDLAGLGMTATVYFPAAPVRQITVPLAAVFQPQQGPSQTRVWVVDEHTRTVKSMPVKTGRPAGNQQVSVDGLKPGMLIVSAGANRLSEGQSVRVLGEDKAQSAARAQAAQIAVRPEDAARRVVK